MGDEELDRARSKEAERLVLARGGVFRWEPVVQEAARLARENWQPDDQQDREARRIIADEVVWLGSAPQSHDVEHVVDIIKRAMNPPHNARVRNED